MRRIVSLGMAVIALCMAAALFSPNPVLAQENADKGTIVVNVVDERGRFFAGNWFLHPGSSINAYPVVRNGAKGEKFLVDPGNYFMEIQRPSDSRYEFKSIRSVNPQYVAAGETIVFNIQYFQTEEQKMLAEDRPYPVASVSAPVSAPVVTTPSAVPAVATPAPAAPAPASAPSPAVEPEEPTWADSEWETADVAPVAVAEESRPMQLATTGPAGLWALAWVSVLLSGFVLTFKRA